MRLFDKNSVGYVKRFSQNDLLQYVESLMKESSALEPTEGNYSWLKSRHMQHDFSKELDAYKPMVSKMTSESCASIAVKLDNLTGGNITTTEVLTIFKRLLLEQHSIQLIEESVTRTKNKKRNRVCPDLGERQPTVSFILE